MNAISPPIQTLLDLFDSHLADVRFGDVDAKSLARIAADVQATADVVTAAQVALDSARIALHERQEALALHAQRALAYARVYAEADESLSAHLEAVTLPRAARRSRADAQASTTSAPNELVLTTSSEAPAARRPRGRPRKLVTPATPTLPEPMLEGLEALAQAGE
jgi:hypothetical protein